MPCLTCGEPVPADAQFCPRCGARADITTDENQSPLPTAIDWKTVRRAWYTRLLDMAKSASGQDLIMEHLDHHEADGALSLNFFLPDNTPAFTIAARDRQPLFHLGRVTPITIRTSHPDLVPAANRLARDYQSQTQQPARVLTPGTL